jgi:hypothetical protein
MLSEPDGRAPGQSSSSLRPLAGVCGALDEYQRRQLAAAWQQEKEERLRAWEAKVGSGV